MAHAGGVGGAGGAVPPRRGAPAQGRVAPAPGPVGGAEQYWGEWAGGSGCCPTAPLAAAAIAVL